jgi:hypothetical protein
MEGKTDCLLKTPDLLITTCCTTTLRYALPTHMSYHHCGGSCTHMFLYLLFQNSTNSFLIESSGPITVRGSCFENNLVGISPIAVYGTQYLFAQNYEYLSSGKTCALASLYTTAAAYETRTPLCSTFDLNGTNAYCPLLGSAAPSSVPSFAPTSPTGTPSLMPTTATPGPSAGPSITPQPSENPTLHPTRSPAKFPTRVPTAKPTGPGGTTAPPRLGTFFPTIGAKNTGSPVVKTPSGPTLIETPSVSSQEVPTVATTEGNDTKVMGGSTANQVTSAGQRLEVVLWFVGMLLLLV